MFRCSALPRLSLCCVLILSAGTFSVVPGAKALAATQQDDASKPGKQKKDNDLPLATDAVKNPTLWHEPSQIAGLDLFCGQGGKEKQPQGPFTFLQEDENGTNPKMDVRDANGKKWRVKEGEEARPEVVASRLLWAMGYYANDDYLVQNATVTGVKMHRGSKDLKEGKLKDVRFSRKPSGQDKIGIWQWRENPFTGSREFNGLRVMMAVMNNWDLKDVNNSVYKDKNSGSQVFLVNDVGATFGANGVGWTRARSKGNIDSFRDSKFIRRLTDTEVDFSTPSKPTGIFLASAGTTIKSYKMRSGLDWIGDNIPRADARWIGSLLGQLSHAQLVDAFRAGNFPAADVDSYVDIVESRIAELKKL
ncbi:MAG: hypothetical protein ACRYGF_09640 [Janthinobacterium lividum]